MSQSCIQSELAGNVKIGRGCVIGPNCQIVSEVGELLIGDYTIIDDGCFIRNNQLKKMTIGSFNHFEMNCRVENSVIGDNNVFEIKTLIESGTQIGNNCRFGCSSKVPPKSLISDFSRIYYPFNFTPIQQYDPKGHREEIQELSQALISIYERKKS